MFELLGSIFDAVVQVLYWRVYVCVLGGALVGFLAIGGMDDPSLAVPFAFAIVGLVIGLVWQSRADDAASL